MELLVSYSNQTAVPCNYNKFIIVTEAADPKTMPEQAQHDQPSRTKQKQTRLARDEILELIERYRAGETIYQLGDAYNINRRTVSAILKCEGVTTRWRKLTDQDLDQAVTLYRSGLSIAAVATRFDVHPTAILRRFRRLGIDRREVGTNQWSRSQAASVPREPAPQPGS